VGGAGPTSPARNALLADVVPAGMYGRAYGFERAMDNLGAIGGPLLALGLVALVGVRGAILASVVPGLLAALAIVYAIRHTPRPTQGERQPIRLKVRPLLAGRLGRLLVGVGAFEVGNVAATLLILRATELLTPSRGHDQAAVVALLLNTGYNLAATLASVPAGRVADARGAVVVLAAGVGMYGLAYAGFAVGTTPLLALAPQALRGSAFWLLAAIQSLGNFAASGVAGLLWTAVSPRAAFGYLTGWLLVALLGLLSTRQSAASTVH
jgi:MFS family permease